MKFNRIRVTIAALAALATIGVGAAPASASPAQPARPAASSSAHVQSATWIYQPAYNGSTLSITPNGTYGIGSAQAIMNEALSIAGQPPYSLAVYNSLMEQLECHLFLLVKKPYNLDTWRPSVSWLTELKDLCNPGYPHLG